MSYLINGREYEWADVTVIGAGRDILGLLGIEYTEKQEKEHLYGKGNKPTGTQKGNKSCEGTMKVRQSELEGLEDLSPSHSILDLEINLSVSYGDPTKGEIMRTDKLYNVQFTEQKKGVNQGDKKMEVDLPFICTDIEWNA
ncbi:MAG: hypothetical protein MJZ81_01185 [Bacteroidales bacterium]|nr:hypothetical protein [Bacteroidales bacterium]